MDSICCLQCGESQAAIRSSQQRRDPIYCAAVDYFGECLWEADRHRFRPWTDGELWNMGILPAYMDRYRRIMSLYEVQDSHRRDLE